MATIARATVYAVLALIWVTPVGVGHDWRIARMIRG